MSSLAQSDRSSLAITGWLLTAALIAFRILPGLAQPGMFFDGVTYATISRNLAIGVGDLAHPCLVPGDAGFYDSPPLGFLLESGFFRALGDHYWVEKLYSALTGLTTAALIVAIWRRLVGNRDELRRLSWLPVALWVAVPGWGWMYSNNMLENTLGLFAVLAVYAILRATAMSDGNESTLARSASEGERPVTRIPSLARRASVFAWLFVGAAAIAAAVLSKGPVGLYPLATPLVAYVTLRRQTLVRAVAENVALVALFFGIIWLVYLLPGAGAYYDKYLHGQVLAAMQGRREVVNSILGRFDILWKVAQQVILPLAIAVGLIWTARRRVGEAGAGGESAGSPPRRSVPDIETQPIRSGTEAVPYSGTRALWPVTAFCLLSGLSASVPIVASLKQSGHYAFPSYAFYALGFALWCAPAVIHLMTSAAPEEVTRWHRIFRCASVATLLLLAVASGLLAGRPRRDGDAYRDALALGRVLPKSSIVGISAELATDFPLLTNLARWDFIGGDPAAQSHRFFLAASSITAPVGYVEVPTAMSRYRLFERAAVAETSEHRRGLSPFVESSEQEGTVPLSAGGSRIGIKPSVPR
jgi:4-amino-4-deoxy-L-arabinose transferase-like glycosyltransferase